MNTQPQLRTTSQKMAVALPICLVLLSSFLWGWLWAQPAPHEEEPSAWSVLTHIQSFEARFEHTLRNAEGVVLQKASGHMALMRPHYLNWEQHKPEPQHLMADGTSVWHHEPALKQVTQSVQDEGLKQTPLGLLWEDEAWLAAHYTLHNVSRTPECHHHTCYRIEAQQEGWPTQQVWIEFDAKGNLKALNSTDEMEQSTQITFSKIYQNGQMHPEEFVWIMPPGVDHITS